MATILMIDDDPKIVDTFDTMFAKDGFNVIRARDGEDGLAKANSENPEVIIVDLIMPKIHGIEFIKRFKPKDHPNCKVIVFSNMDKGDLVRKAMDLGAWKYVSKMSTSPNEMREIVNEAYGSIEKKTPL